MRKSFLPVLLVAVLLLGACSSVQAPAAPTVAPTLAPTPAPTPTPVSTPAPTEDIEYGPGMEPVA